MLSSITVIHNKYRSDPQIRVFYRHISLSPPLDDCICRDIIVENITDTIENIKYLVLQYHNYNIVWYTIIIFIMCNRYTYLMHKAANGLYPIGDFFSFARRLTEDHAPTRA